MTGVACDAVIASIGGMLGRKRVETGITSTSSDETRTSLMEYKFWTKHDLKGRLDLVGATFRVSPALCKAGERED